MGTRIRQILHDAIFTDLSLTSGVDITKKDQVGKAFEKSEASWVLHLAALADVDKCEKEKELAYKINVEGTRNIVEACQKYKKKLIHISTDFVFEGEDEEYFEDSKRGAVDYYGETKILAEDEVMKGLPENRWVILRISHPYKLLVQNEPKKSFFQRMYEVLKSGQFLTAISDFYSRPTYIDDIAKTIERLIQLDFHGVLHCVGGSLLTGYEEAIEICEVFNFDKKLVKAVLLDDYFVNRAKRAHKLNLNNDKIGRELKITPLMFKEGLLEIKRQM